jgi:hypothetical protein
VIHGAQTVFLAAAPIALLALVVVLLLPEVPLRIGAAAGPDKASPAGRAPRSAVAGGAPR